MPQKSTEKPTSQEAPQENADSQGAVNKTNSGPARIEEPRASIVPGTPSPASALGENLSEIKQAFQQTLSQVEKLTKEGELFKQQIAELEKADSEIKQVINTYTQFSLKSNKEKNEVETFVSTTGRMIDAAVGKQKEVVDKVKNDREEQRMVMETTKRDMSLKYADATSQLEASIQNLAEKKKVWESLKSSQQSVDTKLKELKALKIQYEQEGAKNNTGAMYFLMQEMRGMLTQLEIKTPSGLEEELNKSWRELKEATDSVKKKQLARETAKVERDTNESSLKSHHEKSREDILKAIEWNTRK